MTLAELTVTLKGPLWRIHEFEIENIDLRRRIQEEGNEASVTVNNFRLSDDNVLDVFIHVGAPNGTEYEVSIAVKRGVESRSTVVFSDLFRVVRHGRLRIIVSQPL